MRSVALLATIVAAVSASSLQFLAVPSSVELPKSANTLPVKSNDIAGVNANLLGLTAQQVNGFNAKTSLFSRPRALAVIEIDGFQKLNDAVATYDVVDNGFNAAETDSELALLFGADRESVTVDSNGISGSAIAVAANKQQVSGDKIKTKSALLREELEQIYKLAAAVRAQSTKFESKNAADSFRVVIRALAADKLTDEERAVAVADINAAVKELTASLVAAYGDQALVEVYSADAIDSSASNDTQMDSHKRQKRENPGDSEATWNIAARGQFNVYSFTTGDYPAMFLIVGGMSLVLILATIYIAVGMMSMDPGKDSIIYRMTTTRMKRD